jgi:DNA polymerase-3 subunit gamma/tau
VRAIGLVAEALAAVKDGSDARIQLEVALLKAARARSDASVDALLMRIEQLERALGADPAPVADISKRPQKKDTPPPKNDSEPPRAAVSPAPDEPVIGIEMLWPAVLERVQESEGGEMLAALLADARPAALDGDELVLEYPQSASFSKRKIADPANADRLAEALRLVAGRPVSVRVELRDRDEGDEVKAARIDAGFSEDQAIERIKDTFDAEDLSEPESEPEPEGAR